MSFDGVTAPYTVAGPGASTATVPMGATAGPVEVVTRFGTAAGPMFAVVHWRSVTISLQEHPAVALGRIAVDDAFTGCLADRTVKLQRRVGAKRWRTMAVRLSRGDGSYRLWVTTAAPGPVPLQEEEAPKRVTQATGQRGRDDPIDNCGIDGLDPKEPGDGQGRYGHIGAVGHHPVRSMTKEQTDGQTEVPQQVRGVAGRRETWHQLACKDRSAC